MERKEKDAVIEARDLVLSARRNMGIIITEASVELRRFLCKTYN